jgi:hypothetical protein
MVFTPRKKMVSILPWRSRNITQGVFIVEGEHYRQFPTQLQELKEPSPGATFPDRVQILGDDGTLRSLAGGTHQVEGAALMAAGLRTRGAEVAQRRPDRVPMAHDRSHAIPPEFAAAMRPLVAPAPSPAGAAGDGLGLAPGAPPAAATALENPPDTEEAVAEAEAVIDVEDPPPTEDPAPTDAPADSGVRSKFKRRA